MRLLLLLLLLTAPALAQDEPYLPTPDMIVTNDPFPNDPGQIEVLPGYQFTWSDRNFDADGTSQPGDFNRQHSWFTQFTYGTGGNVDVNLYLSDVHGRNAGMTPSVGHGFNDLTMGARWQFAASEDQTQAAALLAYVTFPTGVQPTPERLGLTQQYTSFTPRLVGSKSWGRAIAIADAGYSFALGSNGAGTTGGPTVNLAAGYEMGDEFKVKPLVELNYNAQCFPGAPGSEQLSVTAGLLLIPEDFIVNLAVSRTVSGRNAPDSTTVGIFVTWDS